MEDTERQGKEIEEILKDLDIAFGGLSIPPDGQIVYDNSGYHLECNQIRAKFRNRHWKDISIRDLEGEADSLAFLTNEAFRFFLPAFIQVALLHPIQADLIPDFVLGLLARPDLTKWWEEREMSIREIFHERGIPERILSDLPTNESPDNEASCRERVASLSELQRHAVLKFVKFLQKYRREEFAIGHLERVGEALMRVRS